MSETEEELERMAAEFEPQAKRAKGIRADGPDDEPGDSLVMKGIAVATRACSERLRLRAAEISAARIGYKAQMKPGSADAGQWWMWKDPRGKWDTPGRIGALTGDRVTLVSPRGDTIDEPAEDLIWSARWLYLGNGAEPARL